ncbi:MAG: protein-disulfide reductase DsbD [Pseudomonadales bacterium]|nr:protein-disulfide reductase DsbD [Pseudomonadales bacterium]
MPNFLTTYVLTAKIHSPRLSLFYLTGLALLLLCVVEFSHAQQNTSPLLKQTNAETFAAINGSNDDFLPVEQAYQLQLDFSDSSDSSDASDEQSNTVTLKAIWLAAADHYLYKHGFKQFYIASHDAGGAAQEWPLTAELPAGKLTMDEYFGEVETYYHQVVIPLTFPRDQQPELLRFQSQGCADAGLCYPPYDVYVQLDWQQQSFSFIDPNRYQDQLAKATDFTGNGSLSTETTTASFGFWAAILGAFLGGLILNLMPCVLPVLSIKLMQLQQANASHRMLGLSYMAGVILSFAAIAGLMLLLRQSGLAIGWGFQLQQPWLVACLCLLFFTLGLSLSGFFELGSRFMGLGQNLTTSPRSNGGQCFSAFITGVLAVVVASPCTAPFMGSALGFALTQSNAAAIAVFVALGFGMALPLTLITFIPTLEQWLPKPGLWMVKLKEFFAFPLYLTVIWLLWVLSNQTSSNTLAAMLLALTAVVFIIWCLKFQHPLGRVIAIIGCIAIALFIASPMLQSAESKRSEKLALGHINYSADTLKQLRQQGQAVFIELTADWCITCLANKQRTLGNAHIQQAFRDAGIQYMVGDWTNYDPAITELLEQYGRSGIPLYLLFPTDPEADAQILPQLLNDQLVLDAIQKIK